MEMPQPKFEIAKDEMGRRDFSEYVYIARAYMNADKPDFKAAIQTLTLANERNAEEPQVLLALEMLIMVTKSKCSLLSLS
jgi:hypothetical protein